MATQGASGGGQHFVDPTRFKFYQALSEFLPLDDEQVEERKKLEKWDGECFFQIKSVKQTLSS